MNQKQPDTSEPLLIWAHWEKQCILFCAVLIMMTDISGHLESAGLISLVHTLHRIDLSLSVKPVTQTH